MAIVSVNVTYDNIIYELTKVEENLFSEQLVAPYDTTDIVTRAISDTGAESTQIETIYGNVSWVAPKTDWNTNDYFNAEDYNRIVGNILYLIMFAKKLFGKTMQMNIPLSKAVSDMFYADEMNEIEDLLELINLNTYTFNFGSKMIYTENGNVPIADEYNRIESALLRLYETMHVHEKSLPKLAFTLGNQKGIRV